MRHTGKHSQQSIWRRGRRGCFFKALSWVLLFAVTAPLYGTYVTVLAENECPHHPEHTAECGYAPPVEESPCNHIHDGDCGYIEGDEDAVCTHVHDEACGYAEGSEGSPCQFVCEICAGGGEDAEVPEETPEPVPEEGMGDKTPEPEPVPVEGTGENVPGENPVVDDALIIDDIQSDFATNNTKAVDNISLVSSWDWTVHRSMVWDEKNLIWVLEQPITDANNKLTPDRLMTYLPSELTAVLADGSTEALTLEWNLGTFPGDGDYTGEYMLTAALPEGYELGDEAQQLKVMLKFVRDKYVNNWEYVSRGGSEIREISEYNYYMDYYLVITSDREMLIQKLRSVLPKEIKCEGNNKDGVLVSAGFRYEGGQNAPEDWSTIKGYVDIDWTNFENIVNSVDTIQDGSTLTFDAMPIYNEGYRIRVNSWNKTLPESANDTSEIEGVLNLTITLHEIHLDGHTVPSLNPPSTTVNLFDYWVDGNGAVEDDMLDKTDKHRRENQPDISSHTGVEDWNLGINKERLLLFGDGNIHAGYWNKGAGAMTQYGKDEAGMPGIVQRVLTEGYPVINTEEMTEKIDGFNGISDHMLCGDHYVTEANDSTNPQNISNTVINSWKNSGNSASLDYLFDPEIEIDYKNSYKDATGLFQLDSAGYYYYDMRRNFAEYDKESGEFILYDAPAVDRTDKSYDNGGFTGGRSVGNFFPFNTGAQVFDLVEDQKLSSNENISSSNIKTTAGYMNHHLGMTVNIDFLQPLGGRLNTGSSSEPMSFQFSGDDDVWIFIDDVLVLDLGGIHSEIYGTIDFSTGKICVGQSWKTNGFPYKSDGTVDLEKLYNDAAPTVTTSIRQEFINAHKEDDALWNGDTFASNTSHTLKMFYLERGNYDSSLALRFNLQPMLYQQLKKVDQDGQPLEGVEFDLCPAEETAAGTEGAIRCFYTDSMVHNGDEFYVRRTEGASMVHLRTASDGTARFLDENGNYFNFADRGKQYYILKETKTPDGYRAMPVDIVLYYDSDTSMLSVANRWMTGAYACSVVHAAGTGSLSYAHEDAGTVVPDPDKSVSRQKQEEGLIVAVPMLKRKSGGTWEALYGSNVSGFTASKIGAHTGADTWQDAVLHAVLAQAADDRYPGWYLSWDSGTLRLTGTLNDLPGLAGRYQINNADGDMKMVFGIMEPEALQAMGIGGGDAGTRYEALRNYVREHGAERALAVIKGTGAAGSGSGRGFSFLDGGRFVRNFRSLIYIPNEERELWVMKIDQDGKPYNGAEFGLYDHADCKGLPAARGITASVRGQEGTLIFSPSDDQSPGHARIGWASSERTHYYLKELSAPEGCALNETIVPVVVGTYSIYADAGRANDGVTVMAGVGRLTQILRQYAMSGDVDATLRDITAVEQRQPSGNTEVLADQWTDTVLKGTSDVLRSLNLHYGQNAVVDYGLHDVDGGKLYKPFFVTDTGFIRARVKQNYAAITTPVYENTELDVNCDNLGDTDLTNLFSLLNVVVVTDRTARDTDTGRLAVSKMLEEPDLTASDYTRNFTFTIRLTDAEGRELSGEYYFYGTDKAGYLSSGESFPLHHDESITILGLPAGTRYTVTETERTGWYVFPKTGTVSGRIEREETSFASFYNRKEPWPDIGRLIIHKTVAGNGDRTRDFTFTVTFTDADGKEPEEAFAYTGDKEGRISSGQSVTLHHDQSVTVTLPAGTKYTVIEQEAGQDGYRTSYRGETGTIEDGRLYTAAFLNEIKTGNSHHSGSGSSGSSESSGGTPVSGPGTDPSGNAVASDTLDTGDHTAPLMLLSVICLSSFAGAAMLRRKKRS